MAENGEKRTRKILEGIQYLIGDNKHLREELKEFAQKADEDRRRADQRFERMMEKMDEDRARSDERFATILDQVKRTNRVAVGVARDIREELRELRGQLREGQQQTHQLQEGQQETNQLLGEILKRLPPSNGK